MTNTTAVCFLANGRHKEREGERERECSQLAKSITEPIGRGGEGQKQKENR